MSDTTKTVGSEYLSIQETAARVGCSVRHLERIIASNDRKRVGVGRVGRRVVRINWPVFEAAVMSGTLRS